MPPTAATAPGVMLTGSTQSIDKMHTLTKDPLQPKTEATDKLSVTTSNTLPVSSWRALLEEGDAKGRVKPFQVTPQKADARTPIAKRNASTDHGPSMPPPAGPMTMQTKAYLSLLKESSQNKMPNRAPPTSKKGQNTPPLPELAPMTAASLRDTWSTALNPEPEDPGVKKKQTVTQDDIQQHKLTLDCDLSDAAYYSDTDSVDKSKANASAHSLMYSKRKAAHSYVMQDLTYAIDKSVGLMLSRLFRLSEQQQAITQEKSSQNGHRRFVFGLKEVIRRIKQNCVSCVVVAPDLESHTKEGGLDDRIREIIAFAHQKNVPVIFALSRARLGQSLGRTMPISVLGVLDIKGVKDLFDDAVDLAHKGCQSWLASHERK